MMPCMMMCENRSGKCRGSWISLTFCSVLIPRYWRSRRSWFLLGIRRSICSHWPLTSWPTVFIIVQMCQLPAPRSVWELAPSLSQLYVVEQVVVFVTSLFGRAITSVCATARPWDDVTPRTPFCVVTDLPKDGRMDRTLLSPKYIYNI